MPEESVLKTTCMYPVEDLYTSVELTLLPDNLSISLEVLHSDGDDDDAQLLMVTWSQHDSVRNDVKEIEISPSPLAARTQ